MIGRRTKVGLLILLGCLAGSAAPQAQQTRFIALQLIIGDRWNGEHTISYPSGRFIEGVRCGVASIWVGPRQWQHPATGRTLTVYFRSRDGQNTADQIFAVRGDQTAIGRVADSRFGITACDQEAKYPLGLWNQGETRTFEYVCWYGNERRAKVTTITIQDIDYECFGMAHCLRIEWVLRDKQGSGRPLDHRVYVFAPNQGMVSEAKAN